LLLDELSALEHAVGESFIVSATNHEDSGVDTAELDHAEVVGEIASKVDCEMSHLHRGPVQNTDCLRVLLGDVQLFGESLALLDNCTTGGPEVGVVELLGESLSPESCGSEMINLHDLAVDLFSAILLHLECCLTVHYVLDHHFIHH